MPHLRIPGHHVGALASLLALDDDRVANLSTILRKAPLTWDGDQLLASVVDETGESGSGLSEIIGLLLSLTALRLRLDLDPLKLAGIVCNAMNESQYEELKIGAEDEDSFTRRLAELLNTESLLYATKGPPVILAHENVFAHARIITDIRPIFGADVTDRPSVATIVHTMQLTYQQGDNVKEFYVAMDKEDLNLLGDVLKRAAAKEDNLRSVLQEAGMTTIWE